ncbi:glycosyltransferase family A protein [Pedobacter helvus]|uniref:Glycosyltransferase family A protein n=1 Tax=Pedobacter helvus TaxID=2563444 RepID=A0ABW9JIS6_9SPHI|nr:glycosyltransferase family A protein [Pedobacter ureilyticus]
MQLDYSIIICTYNPDEEVFTRCLNAVEQLDKRDLKVEVLLMDNNSTNSVGSLKCVESLLEKVPDSKLILVKEQGLTHARAAGIEAAKGRYVVFFDDDNEPETGYLQELKRLNANYNHVAAWGPGIVKVDFIAGIEKALEGFARAAFQQRETDYIAYSNLRSWQECYPFGTGLSVRKELLISYIKMLKKGIYSMTDRKGNNLSSGGDTQMVLFCVKSGFAAGVSPELKMTHIVPSKRANFQYLQRLSYGTYLCYSQLQVEVFPGKFDEISKAIISETRFKKKVLTKFVKFWFRPNPVKQLEFTNYIAANCGEYNVVGKAIPKTVQWVIKKLNLS